MRITLSLVPEVILHRREQTTRRRFVVGVPLLVVAAVAVLYAVLSLQVAAARQAAREADAQLERIRPLATYLAQLQAEIDDLEKRRQALDLRAGRQRRLEPMLGDVSRFIPPDVWLQSLVIESGSVRLAGYSLELRSVAQFATALQRSTRLERITVEELQQARSGRRIITQFVIGARLRGSAP